MWQLGAFVLWNQDDARYELSIRVDRGEDTLLDETRELAGGASTRVENPISEPGSYRVHGSNAVGESAAYEWSLDCQGEAEYLQVLVTDSGAVEIRQMNQTIVPPPPC